MPKFSALDAKVSAAVALSLLVGYIIEESTRVRPIKCENELRYVSGLIRAEEKPGFDAQLELNFKALQPNFSHEKIRCVGRAIRITTKYVLIYDQCSGQGTIKPRNAMTQDEISRYII